MALASDDGHTQRQDNQSIVLRTLRCIVAYNRKCIGLWLAGGRLEYNRLIVVEDDGIRHKLYQSARAAIPNYESIKRRWA